MHPKRFFCHVFLAGCLLLLTGLFQTLPAQKKNLQPSDYDQWESLGSHHLSADGRWLAYEVITVGGDQELRLRDLRSDSVRTVPEAYQATFSADGRWLAYYTSASGTQEEEEAYYEAPYEDRVELLDLRSGELEVFRGMAEFAFDRQGSYLALNSYGYGNEGSSLLLLDLESGYRINFGNVTAFSWSEKTPLLALLIQTRDGNGNGVQLYQPATGSIRVLESSTRSYQHLAWRRGSDDLAVMRLAGEEEEEPADLVAWRDVLQREPRPLYFQPDSITGFPDTLEVSGAAGLKWAGDGSKLYFGARRQPAPPESYAASDTTEAALADSSDALAEIWRESSDADVQIWHSTDVRIIPQQQAALYREEGQSLPVAWKLDDNRYIPIGADAAEEIEVLGSHRHATESDAKPYPFGAMFGRPYRDIYLIDLEDGGRRKVLDSIRHYYGGSPDGRFLLFFQGDDFYSYEIESGRRRNLTGKLDGRFVNGEYDFPVAQLPPYGFAGWVKEQAAAIVYDRYDLWRIELDGGGARRLTDGAGERIIHRYLALEEAEEGPILIDLKAPVYCTLKGERTQGSGFARLRPGKRAEVLVFRDQRLQGLTKAAAAEVFLFGAEAFDDPPDLFVTDAAFRDVRQVTALNPFQEEYAWGRAELLDFESTAGLPLQAALFYPANYDPAKRYPMLVYTYELLTDRLHEYVVPNISSLYNFTLFTSEGYFVLAPDIVYRPRDPGRSAVEAVEGAVRSVIDRGLVDPARIGLMGHSWGGYQATFIPTQSDLFAASVAGAPITNFMSFMGAIHWNPGLPEVDHWETGQARMEVPFWEDLEAHLRNSPASFVHQLRTPLLMAFGNADGVVDWHQGVEFYNFARRAGKKDLVLLVYPGEDHGLDSENVRIDYNRRIMQWFGHYLKGEAAERWIREGVPLREQDGY